MCKKHKKVCRVLNYIIHLLIANFSITGIIKEYNEMKESKLERLNQFSQGF